MKRMSLSKRRTVPAMSGRRARLATLLFSRMIPSYVNLCSLCFRGTLHYRGESVHPRKNHLLATRLGKRPTGVKSRACRPRQADVARTEGAILPSRQAQSPRQNAAPKARRHPAGTGSYDAGFSRFLRTRRLHGFEKYWRDAPSRAFLASCTMAPSCCASANSQPGPESRDRPHPRPALTPRRSQGRDRLGRDRRSLRGRGAGLLLSNLPRRGPSLRPRPRHGPGARKGPRVPGASRWREVLARARLSLPTQCYSSHKEWGDAETGLRLVPYLGTARTALHPGLR